MSRQVDGFYLRVYPELLGIMRTQARRLIQGKQRARLAEPDAISIFKIKLSCISATTVGRSYGRLLWRDHPAAADGQKRLSTSSIADPGP